MSEQQPELTGACHCGAVSWSYQGRPKRLVACNCSICRRLRALWAHGPEGVIQIQSAADATLSCKTGGCTTHWQGLEPESPRNMAVNAALCDPQDIADLPLRHFDGADTWQFLD